MFISCNDLGVTTLPSLDIEIFYGADIKYDTNQIAFIDDFGTSIYDIDNKTYTKIYDGRNYPIGERHLNLVWAKNKIYFDENDTKEIEESKYDEHIAVYSIKQYNSESGEITDFIDNGYILNASPDKNYLVYVDESNEKTIIHDIQSDQSFEIPLSIEVEWMPDSKGFYYIPVEETSTGKIYRQELTPKGRKIIEMDVSNYLGENQTLLNLYHDKKDGWLFDIGTYEEKEYNPPYEYAAKWKKNMFIEYDTYRILMEE